jgi:hypothetical protein
MKNLDFKKDMKVEWGLFKKRRRAKRRQES